MRAGILAQVSPAAATETMLYQCTIGQVTNLASILVCNTSTSDTTIRVAIVPGGGGTTTGNYIMFDHPLCAYDTLEWSPNVEIGLGPMDIIRVFAGVAGVSFHAYGLREVDA